MEISDSELRTAMRHVPGRKKSGLALVIGGAVLTFRQLLTPSVANAAAAGDVAALAA